MRVSRLLVGVLPFVIPTFASSAGAFPRGIGSGDKTAAAARQQSSRGDATVPATTAARTDDTQNPGSRLKMKWESGKLSLDAEAVPLSEVLLGVSRATGIEITGAKGLNHLVTVHLAGVELSQALRELLLHIDYAILMDRQSSTSPQRTRLIIFGKSLPRSSSTGSVAESETNAPTAEAAIQAEEAGEDRQVVTDVQQQFASQPVQTDQQTASPDAVQPPTQNADAVGPEVSSEDIPGTDSQLDPGQSEKLAAIEAAATNQDPEVLGNYMQDPNAAVKAAAFDALAALDNPAAVENLLTEINDVNQPDRLQALQLLAQSPQVDEQTVMTTLVDALNGADPSFSAYAAQALAERGTPEAMNALSEMLNGSNTATRLTILQSVAQTEAGLSLLHAALSDFNETVRSAAAALLQQGESAKNP